MIVSLALAFWTLAFGYSCRFEVVSRFVRPLSVFVTSGLNSLTSLVPFSLAQIVLPVFILSNIIYIIVCLCKKKWLIWLPKVINSVVYVYFCFVFLYGYAFNLAPASDMLPYHIEKHSTETLVKVTELLISDLNEASLKIKRGQDGVVVFKDFKAQNELINDAYLSLNSKYHFSMHTRIGRAKPSGFLSVPMSYWNTSGFYFMFLAEANVTEDMVPTHIPYIMAHEQAHTLGIVRENEANFFAFLASMETNDEEIRYSALLNAYVYAINSVYSADLENHARLSGLIYPDVRNDLDRLSEHLKKYETPVKEIGDKINDTMLKSNGQADGIKTYGYMTDLLISYYLNQ